MPVAAAPGNGRGEGDETPGLPDGERLQVVPERAEDPVVEGGGSPTERGA